MALTDLSVRTAKAGKALYKLSDGRGLQLHITTIGSKLWRWAYRFDGKQKLIATGTDPMVQRKVDKINRQQAAGNTFKAIATAWWEHWKSSRSERHADYVQRRLQGDILPAIIDPARKSMKS